MSRWTWVLAALVGVALGALAMLGVDRARGGPAGPAIRAYLLDHPEVIAEAMQRLQDRDSARTVGAYRDVIEHPYPGAVAGDAKGDVTVAEWFDYNCGYCRASLPILAQLLQEDPHVRVVYREYPVLAASSRTAARASLAAAAQGRYAAFHAALYAGGPVSDASIAAAARSTGVDVTRIPADADAELDRNRQLAGALGIGGTPSWVIGDRVLSGAQPLDKLKEAIAAARAR